MQTKDHQIAHYLLQILISQFLTNYLKIGKYQKWISSLCLKKLVTISGFEKVPGIKRSQKGTYVL